MADIDLHDGAIDLLLKVCKGQSSISSKALKALLMIYPNTIYETDENQHVYPALIVVKGRGWNDWQASQPKY